MRKVCNFTDYFVIASGSSDRQVKTIADGIEESLKKNGLFVRNKEGYKEGSWVVIDSANVIAHIFHQETRKVYSLESLWAKAKKVKIK